MLLEVTLRSRHCVLLIFVGQRGEVPTIADQKFACPEWAILHRHKVDVLRSDIKHNR